MLHVASLLANLVVEKIKNAANLSLRLAFISTDSEESPHPAHIFRPIKRH